MSSSYIISLKHTRTGDDDNKTVISSWSSKFTVFIWGQTAACLYIIIRNPKMIGKGLWCRKLPTGYNGEPRICPKITSSRGSISKPNYLPHSWIHPTYYFKLRPYTISWFATMHRTDRHTDQQMVGGNCRW